jgi:hypothetical protein
LHESLADLGLRTDSISVRHTPAAPSALEATQRVREWHEAAPSPAPESRVVSGTTFAEKSDGGARAEDDRRAPRQSAQEHRHGFRSRRHHQEEQA